MNKLQLPVGSVFAYTKEGEFPPELRNGRVVEIPNDAKGWETSCAGCLFAGETVQGCCLFACLPHERTDAKNVKFLEVKGGGE